MYSRVMLASPLVLPLLAAALAVPDEFEFVPAEGLSLTKTFEVARETESEESSDRGSSTSESTSSRTLVVTDVYDKTDDERVTQLTRTYDEIGSESESSWQGESGSNDSSTTGSSDLEGATVVFEWDEDEEEHLPSSDEVDDEVLDALPYDLDFLALLPDGEVDEGDEWEVEVETFEFLMNPWKGMPWEMDLSDGETIVVEGGDEDEGDDDTSVDESTDGEITATYAGTRDVDGIAVAVITLEGEVETEITIDQDSDFDGGSSTYHQESTRTGEIEGKLLWNIEGKHLHSLRIAIDMEEEGSSENTVSFGDREFSSESESEESGEVVFTASFEAAEEE